MIRCFLKFKLKVIHCIYTLKIQIIYFKPLLFSTTSAPRLSLPSPLTFHQELALPAQARSELMFFVVPLHWHHISLLIGLYPLPALHAQFCNFLKKTAKRQERKRRRNQNKSYILEINQVFPSKINAIFT